MKKACILFIISIIILSFPLNMMAQDNPAVTETQLDNLPATETQPDNPTATEAQPDNPTVAPAELRDKIVAVVGNKIILLSELRRVINNLMLTKNMDPSTTSEIVLQSLLRKALQDMINEQLLLVKAAQDSIQVDLRQVDTIEKEQLASIKASTTPEDLEKIGLTEQQLRYMIHNDAYNYVLTQTISEQIRSTISVTPQEMDTWIATHRDSLPEMPEQFKISHILLYPKVSEENKARVQNKLQAILDRINNGEDFGELAKEHSQDTGSGQYGGDVGYFTRERMVPEFSDAAFALEVGEVSGIVESQYGFHIIKVEDIRGDEIQARHILLLLKPEAEDIEIISNRLKQFKKDVLSGESTFEEIAKEYSEDESSKALGGKLQWLFREQGIASFVAAAEKMEKGQISEPFESQFGYHIIQLDDYKPSHNVNIKDDNYLIRRFVTDQKNAAELDRILEKLRNNAYISIRLE